jgi:macrocin-O-methyltransferase TylF-like protien
MGTTAPDPASARLHELSQIRHERGFCWIADLPPDTAEGDNSEDLFRSGLRLFEDGREIGPGHAVHEEIRTKGGGRFSHWGRTLYFSSSDNVSPNQKRCGYLALLEQSAMSATARMLLEASQVDVAMMSPGARYDWGERLFTTFVPGEPLGEAGRSCFRDEAFRASYERFSENRRSFDRKYALREFARLAATLPGDMAECGVYRGATAYLLAEACAAGRGRSVHLFDSFAGISTPGEHDGSFWQPGDMAASIEVVRAGLGDLVEWVAFHSGWIPERFPDVADRQFALVHIDLDLYQPTRDAVEFFYARLVDRGILVCDDYGFETCPGARRAMDEFFADKPLEHILHLPTGQGVVLRRRT